MNVAQMEYGDTYRDPPPTVETRARMRFNQNQYDHAIERLQKTEAILNALKRLGHENTSDYNRFTNTANQIALQIRDFDNEFVEIARRIVAENDNAELIT